MKESYNRGRIYLSGPITGVPDYLEIFNDAAMKLRAEGYSVINPANLCTVLDDQATYEEYMEIDIALLRKCDALVQLPGWQQSLGCNREYGVALERDMIILQYGEVAGWTR